MNLYVRITFYLGFYLANVVANYDLFVMLITFPLFAIVLTGIVNIQSKYFGLLDMFWLVSYLMFVIRPIQNIKGDTFFMGPVSGIKFQTDSFLTTSLILILFYFTVLLIIRSVSLNRISNQSTDINMHYSGQQLLFLFSLFIVVFLVYLKLSGGLSNVLLPRAQKATEDISQGSFILYSFLSVILFYFITIYIQLNKKIKYFFFLVILFLLMLIVSNPLNTPRFFLLATWVPVLFIVFKGKLSLSFSYIASVFLITIVFPILSITTRFGFEKLSDVDLKSFGYFIWHLPYIDTYDMLVYLVARIEDIGFRFGESLIGMVLFFIPRAIWSDKPGLIALELGNDLYDAGYAGTANLSMFYGAELYMDFWYLGVIFAGVITGKALNYINKKNLNQNIIDSILMFIVFSSLPILIRGPFAAIVGLPFFQIFWFFVLKKLIIKGRDRK